MKTVLFFFCATFAGAAWGDIYRCPGPDGQPRFQDQSCAAGQKIEVKDRNAGIGGGSGNDWLARQADLDAAKEAHKVMLGMTEDQVRAAWGAPDKVNDSFYGAHRQSQWVYKRGASAQYIYFTDGLVSGWN